MSQQVELWGHKHDVVAKRFRIKFGERLLPVEDRDAEIASVQKFTSMTAISSAQPLTDAHLDVLTHIPTITWIDLQDTLVTDAGIPYLRRLKNLTYLRLKEMGITDAAMAHVGKITTLTNLQIHGTKVTDRGLGHLHELQSLTELMTSGYDEPISFDALVAISKAIPEAQIFNKGRALFINGERH